MGDDRMTWKQSTAVTATNPMSRRKVGKREWRVTVYELLESEQAGLSILRSISNRHPTDAETQRLCGQGFEETAERVIRLNQLLGYRDEKEEQTNGQLAVVNGTPDGGSAS